MVSTDVFKRGYTVPVSSPDEASHPLTRTPKQLSKIFRERGPNIMAVEPGDATSLSKGTGIHRLREQTS
jgi:hypothetical protein